MNKPHTSYCYAHQVRSDYWYYFIGYDEALHYLTHEFDMTEPEADNFLLTKADTRTK